MIARTGSRYPKLVAPALPTFLVICEGKTEVQYFKNWERKLRGKARFVIKGEGLAPKTLVERALKEFKSLVKEGVEPSSIRIWCVGDRDDHHGIEEALDHAERKGIGYALSIPCLELWFSLHFQSITSYIHRDDVIRISKDHLSITSKNLTTPALELLDEKVDEAISRAEALDLLHEGNQSSKLENPRSWIYRLVVELKAL